MPDPKKPAAVAVTVEAAPVEDASPVLVTCAIDGWVPGLGVLLRSGSNPYPKAEAAAIVAQGLGTYTPAASAPSKE